MTKSIFLLIICCLLNNIQNLHADIFIHQLQHHSATNVIPLIQPHLSSETRLTAKGVQLIVSGSEKDNQKVVQILQSLDTRSRQYLVEVKILNQEMNQYQLNATKLAGDTHSGGVKIKRLKSQGNQSNGDNFILRTTENHQALVSTGESFPSNQITSQFGHLVPSSGRVSTNSGFYITIQQTADQTITMSVSAEQQSRQVNKTASINSSSTSTRISGPLGKWVLIASNARRSDLGSSKRYSTNSRSSKQRWYYVRVNEVVE